MTPAIRERGLRTQERIGATAIGQRIDGGRDLTIATAREIGSELSEALHGCESVLLDLRRVRKIDAVGLVLLLDAVKRAEARGSSFRVLGSAWLRTAVVRAHLADEIPVSVDDAEDRGLLYDVFQSDERAREDHSVVLDAGDFVLRALTPADIEDLERWAHDDGLQRVVGSDLLYQVRHLGADHPSLAEEVLWSPKSFTLIVQGKDAARPSGFIRLNDVNLVESYGALELVLADAATARRGWGVVAARHFGAFTHDVLRLSRIQGTAYEDNRLSINTMRRNGFRDEGVLRSAARSQDGARRNIVVLSLLPKDLVAMPWYASMARSSLWPA